MFKRMEVGGDVVARAIVAGFASGLRSQATFPVLTRAANEGRLKVSSNPPFGWLRSETVGWLAYLSAAGEMVVDKLPFTPSRIKPEPLAGRAFFGAISGSIVANASDRPWIAGAVPGVLGAVVGSFTGYWVRKRIVQSSGLPDVVVALGEDALAHGLSRTLVTS
jgi:uncharacterized membrane protein